MRCTKLMDLAEDTLLFARWSLLPYFHIKGTPQRPITRLYPGCHTCIQACTGHKGNIWFWLKRRQPVQFTVLHSLAKDNVRQFAWLQLIVAKPDSFSLLAVSDSVLASLLVVRLTCYLTTEFTAFTPLGEMREYRYFVHSLACLTLLMGSFSINHYLLQLLQLSFKDSRALIQYVALIEHFHWIYFIGVPLQRMNGYLPDNKKNSRFWSIMMYNELHVRLAGFVNSPHCIPYNI